MIESITIKGFKRFKKERFEFKNLTILAGLNGSGKTSLIHGLLVAREAAISQDKNSVNLKEKYGIELGTAEDVLNWDSREQFSFDILHDSKKLCSWTLIPPHPLSLYLSISKKMVDDGLPVSLLNKSRVFTYLCAERLGPRSMFELSPTPEQELEVGIKGENCAQIISALGSFPLNDSSRLHPDTKMDEPVFLSYQLEKWLSEIARPVEIKANRPIGAHIATLSFKAIGGEWVQATNMGFGVSYALPIILAGLIAQKGGVILVENPEAHLHPAGQSRMGVFLSWLASKGVQVILETHSDHVLNGVRRSIAEYNYIKSDNANVLFFDSSDAQVSIKSLEFNSLGGMSKWPQSFFDQYQIDTAALGRLRRRVSKNELCD
ncbi:AAA family ATPase [Serratia marcescens]|uniref:AAA family ATPase n=1 Tax=Serratia marcescens TaxID=615 RepID=UPI0029CE4CBD|nr:DUF3696 domain-containing protein [Serratia marcescens]